MTVHLSVDRDRCIGGGQCVIAAEDVFDQDEADGTVVLLQAEPPDDQRDRVQQAARLCPASAITVGQS